MNDNFTDEEKKGFYKAIYSRRDVRSHFTSEPINDNTLTKILHAAHHAPSVGFSQPWNFVLIKDNNTKKPSKNHFKLSIGVHQNWLMRKENLIIYPSSWKELWNLL